MAVTVGKSYRLANPGRVKRRKSNPTKKRKLSPKQIAIFGTARQKAVLRAKRSRTRNAGKFSLRKTKKNYKKTGVVRTKPFKKISQVHGRLRRKARRKNIGEIVSISLAGLGNPGKKRRTSNMAAKRRRKARKNYGTVVGRSFSHTKVGKRKARKNSGVTRRRRRTTAAHRTTRRRRGNPGVYRVRRVHRRGNPGIGGITGGIIGKALGVIGGAIATKYLTQFVLQGNNMSWVGYAGNAASAVALGWAAKKVTKSQEFGNSVMVGGLAATALRMLQDMTPIGNYVNLSLSGARKGGDVGIGIIGDSSFFMPQVAQPGSMTSFITPSSIRSYVGNAVSAQTAAMAKAGAPAAMSGGRGVGRMGRNTRAVL